MSLLQLNREELHALRRAILRSLALVLADNPTIDVSVQEVHHLHILLDRIDGLA